jgi:hypothetical protein
LDYYLKDHDGKLIESRLEIIDSSVILHSRSGRSRTAPGRNPGYVEAFATIFRRLSEPRLSVERVLLDSIPAQDFPEEKRILATRSDFETTGRPATMDTVRQKMRAFGRGPDMPANEGNQNKRIRIDTDLAHAQLLERLGVSLTRSRGKANLPHSPRLPASDLRRVRTLHIERALRRLELGEEVPGFTESRDYDALTTGGSRYAPKKLFALAIEEALGAKVTPSDFSAGWGTPCFDIIEASGLWIVAKSEAAARPRPSADAIKTALDLLAPNDEERVWVEGNPKIATHLKRERAAGLAKRKREAFIAEHKRLYCERCKLDPVKLYGVDAGPACIEVHHHKTHVANMDAGYETHLDDLMCLCANCHRVLHRALTLGVPFEIEILARVY